MARSVEFETQRSLLVALERPTLITSFLKATLAVVQTRKPQIEINDALMVFGAAFIKSETIATSKALLQYAAVETLPTQNAVALTKNIPALALRKYEVEESRFSAAYEVALYAPFGIVFTHLATYLVQQAVDTIAYLTTQADSTKKQVAWKDFKKVSAKNGKTLVNAVVFGTLGYAIGTLILPGRGTLIVGMIFEVIPYAI